MKPIRPILLLTFLILLPLPAQAAVEVAMRGRAPQTVTEVYVQAGEVFLPLEEVLAAVGISGTWDSVEHVYRFPTPSGTARLSPGSRFVRVGERFIPVRSLPRFIDGRLRVAENFVTDLLPDLLRQDVFYRNLDPATRALVPQEELDSFLAYTLRRREGSGKVLRGIVLDPGHGGEDPGAIGRGGIKEKTVVLELGLRLQKLIKMRWGIPVQTTRDGDYSLSLRKRFELTAAAEADLLVMLHAQGAFGRDARGVVLLVRPPESDSNEPLPGAGPAPGESRVLARHLETALAAAGLPVAGIFEAPLLPLGRGNLPTVLVEAGFLTNPEEAARLESENGLDRLAGALYAGLRSYAEERGTER